MKGLDDARIQSYVDGELNPQEEAAVEKHAAKCKNCQDKIEKRRHLAISIREALNEADKETDVIPVFSPHASVPEKTFHLSPGLIPGFAAAACITLLLILVPSRKEAVPLNQDMILMVPAYAGDVDANRSITNQSWVIQVIDAQGNVREYNMQ